MPCLACGLPSTSEQIARVAKLDERYVREWLARSNDNGRHGRVRPCYAQIPPAAAGACRLPDARAAGIDNLAMLTQYIWEMWKARQGGGMLSQRRRLAVFAILSVPAIASRRNNESF